MNHPKSQRVVLLPKEKTLAKSQLENISLFISADRERIFHLFSQ